MLIGAHNRVRESGGFLGLVCPDDKVRRVLRRITGLDKVFTLYDTVPERRDRAGLNGGGAGRRARLAP